MRNIADLPAAKRTRHLAVAVAACAAVAFVADCALAQSADKPCSASVGRDFPPASARSRQLAIEPLVRLLRSLDEQRIDVRAFLLLKDCELVVERYKAGVGRDDNHAVYSVTKSVVSTLVGSLLKDRKIAGLDLPVASLVARPPQIDDTQWQRASTLTLRNVMNMASGYAYVHNPTNSPLYDIRRDRFAYAIGQQIAAAPGERFNYSDADASITGAVASAAAGETLDAYAQRVLFEPMKMFNHAWWFRDAAGRYPGGWGLRLRPMDMLKIGQLYMQRGQWNGRAVFDPQYRSLAWTHGPSPEYGLHWWIGRPAGAVGTDHYAAIGLKGQRIYVYPDLGIVIAIVASLPADEERKLADAVLGAMRESVAKTDRADASAAVHADLAQLLRAGFQGITRTPQSPQDTPSHP